METVLLVTFAQEAIQSQPLQPINVTLDTCVLQAQSNRSDVTWGPIKTQLPRTLVQSVQLDLIVSRPRLQLSVTLDFTVQEMTTSLPVLLESLEL
jgi:hypothetical protein